MKKLGRAVLYFLAYLVMAFLLSVIFALLNAPAGFLLISFLLPIIILVVYADKHSVKQKYVYDSTPIELPKKQQKDIIKAERLPSKKECQEKSKLLNDEAANEIMMAYSCSSISRFVELGKEINTNLNDAIRYEKKGGCVSGYPASQILEEFNNAYQEKLRDVIEREAEITISEINDPQHNNKRACCQSFLDEINAHKEYFSEETLQFAMTAYCNCLKVAATNDISMAYECSSISRFVDLGKEINANLNDAIDYENKGGCVTGNTASQMLEVFNNDYQWKLRDAIEREENITISEINGPQHNNKRACCQSFLDEINAHKEYFSEETLQFAMRAYYNILSEAGLSVQNMKEGNEGDPLSEIDQMDGHEFEYYCKDLLSKNGFTNVRVTKGSGDQGADILAEKDEIKYAIQCKHYNSDLGNKPVQEALAGRDIYKCQVAAVLTNSYFTKGAKDAANATGVLLWDRDKLISLIENADKES